MSTVGQMERLFKRVGEVLTINADASLTDAAEKMAQHDVGALIVLDGLEIVGICSERDIVAAVASRKGDACDAPVRDRMTANVIYCAPGTPVVKARRIMAAHGIRHLPIVADGVAVGMISSRDMLAYRLYETSTRLAEAEKDARAADEAKSNFLSNVGYEVRTPMTGIIGMTELVLDTALTAEQRDFLGVVKDSASSLLSVITNILDYSEISAGRVKLSQTEFELRSVLDEALLGLQPAAGAKGLKLLGEVAPDVPNELVGDPDRLRSVLDNLVANAIKFTDAGEVEVRVEVEVPGDEKTDFHFSVRDTGVGIAREQQEQIFEAFTSGDGSYRRSDGGPGLGLAMAARLVDLMGGRIWLDSEVGRGSTFHFVVAFSRLQPAEPALQGAT